MIPRENLYKREELKFRGSFVPWSYVVHEIMARASLNCHNSLELQHILEAIAEENIIFPLELNKSNQLPNDKKGCRVYDWKILSTPQIKNAMKLNGNFQRVEVALPITQCMTAFVSEENALPILDNTYEKYDKFLNVTYLVNDEFLQNWCDPYYEEENVANKKVKSCSVSELLFAVRKKLDKCPTNKE